MSCPKSEKRYQCKLAAYLYDLSRKPDTTKVFVHVNEKIFL